ncbi:MAG: FlgD immunoglobulin-like domain containing protein [Candidatus Eisenbacteria bacterium]
MTTPCSRPALATALLALALGLPSIARADWPHDANGSGVPIVSAAGDQADFRAVSDGDGGVLYVWSDPRGAANDIYAQRISSAGAALWTANGVLVCGATNSQLQPTAAPDGFGGLVIAWSDSRSGAADIYAQRLNASGVPQWTANGVLVCNATGVQATPSLVSDGAGGAILTWADARSGGYDLYAQRLNANGVAQWAANGVVVCNAATDQFSPQMVPDGSGGAYVAWDDARGGAGSDVFAQRILSTGAMQWTANGLTVCNATNGQNNTRIAADGTGGVVLAWQDLRGGATYDIYAQRLSASGVALWAFNGTAVSVAAENQGLPTVVADGSGGVIVGWQDLRSVTEYDVYAQRVLSGGGVAWTANGVALSTAANSQTNIRGVSDGAGGAIFAWEDYRLGYGTDIAAQRISGAGVTQWASSGLLVSASVNNQFTPTPVTDGNGGAIIGYLDPPNAVDFDLSAMRVERFGQLGNPEPRITGVKDVKNDQGGFVKLSWSNSWLDADPQFGVFDYRIWRSVPAGLAQSSAASRAITTNPDEAAANGSLLVLASAAPNYAWEIVGTQSAAGLSAYSYVAATTADSVPGSFPRTVFMVEARSSTSVAADHWYSAPDSGYSVDNLAPAAPAPFTGQYGAGSTALHWNPNHEPDLAGYRLYRGSSMAFVPGPGNFVAELPDTGYADAAAAPYIYKLTAVDEHGNESPVATLMPSGTLGVGGGGVARAFFELASANPARGGAALRFGLASAGRVSVALYDAGGRRVRTLANGEFAAGEHAIAWDGCDDGGRAVAAGLYFAKLEAPGFGATRRIVRTD